MEKYNHEFLELFDEINIDYAVSRQIEIDSTKNIVLRSIETHKEKHYRPFAWLRKWQVAAIASVIAVLCLMCIPTVRATIFEWWRSLFSVSEYMTEESPSMIPQVEQYIQESVEPKTETTVAKAKIEILDDSWGEWAKGLDIQIKKALVDGEELYISGELFGNAKDIIGEFLEDKSLPRKQVYCKVSIRVGSSIYSDGALEIPQKVWLPYAVGKMTDEQRASYDSIQSIPFTATIPYNSTIPNSDISFLTLYFGEYDVYNFDEYASVRTSSHKVVLQKPLTIDYENVSAPIVVNGDRKIIPLTGSVPVLLVDQVNAQAMNVPVYLGECSVQVDQVSFSLSEMQLDLTFVLPEKWGVPQQKAFLNGLRYNLVIGNERLDIIDSVNREINEREGQYSITLSSTNAALSRLVSVDNVSLSIEFSQCISINGMQLQNNVPVDISNYHEGYEVEETIMTLIEIPITLELD